MKLKCIFMYLFVLLAGITFAVDFPDGIQHQKIKGIDMVYTKSDVDSIINNLNVDSKTNRYPMFIIDLNNTLPNYIGITNETGCITNLIQNEKNPYSTTTWCEFELKATTNNFLNIGNDMNATLQITNQSGEIVKTIPKVTKGLRIEQHLLFFSISSMQLEFKGEFADERDKADPLESMRKYVNAYKVQDKEIDGRKLTFYTSSIEDLENPFPSKVIVILDPSKFKRTSDNSWCNDHNKDLNWVYLRGGIDSFEKDVHNKYVWKSIKPVAWFEDLPAWAYTNNEVRIISEEQYKKQK